MKNLVCFLICFLWPFNVFGQVGETKTTDPAKTSPPPGVKIISEDRLVDDLRLYDRLYKINKANIKIIKKFAQINQELRKNSQNKNNINQITRSMDRDLLKLGVEINGIEKMVYSPYPDFDENIISTVRNLVEVSQLLTDSDQDLGADTIRKISNMIDWIMGFTNLPGGKINKLYGEYVIQSLHSIADSVSIIEFHINEREKVRNSLNQLPPQNEFVVLLKNMRSSGEQIADKINKLERKLSQSQKKLAFDEIEQAENYCLNKFQTSREEVLQTELDFSGFKYEIEMRAHKVSRFVRHLRQSQQKYCEASEKFPFKDSVKEKRAQEDRHSAQRRLLNLSRPGINRAVRVLNEQYQLFVEEEKYVYKFHNCVRGKLKSSQYARIYWRNYITPYFMKASERWEWLSTEPRDSEIIQKGILTRAYCVNGQLVKNKPSKTSGTIKNQCYKGELKLVTNSGIKMIVPPNKSKQITVTSKDSILVIFDPMYKGYPGYKQKFDIRHLSNNWFYESCGSRSGYVSNNGLGSDLELIQPK